MTRAGAAQRGLFSETPSPELPCQSTRSSAFQLWAGGCGGTSITTTMGTQGWCPRSGSMDTHLPLSTSEAEGEIQAANWQCLASSIHGWSKSCFIMAAGSHVGLVPPIVRAPMI